MVPVTKDIKAYILLWHVCVCVHVCVRVHVCVVVCSI